MRTIPFLLAVTLFAGAGFAKGPEPAAQLIIREIRYDAKLAENDARFTVDIDAEMTGRGDAAVLLFEGDVAVFAPKLPAGVRIKRDGNEYWLHATKAGRLKCKFDLVAKIKRVEPWNELTFDGPDATIASVAAQVNAAGAELRLLSGTTLESEQKENSARVHGFLGPDRAVTLRWQSKAGEERRKEVVACETTATAQVTPTVIKFTTKLRYEILQGSLARVTVALPAAQSITKLEGEQIRDWQVKEQILTIEFIKPVEKAYALTLYSEQLVDATPFAGQITPPQPLEVARETGAFALGAEDVLAEIESANGLRQVNASTNQIAAYRYYARPAMLGVRVRRIEPVVNVTGRVNVRLEESRLLVRHALTLNVEKAGIYTLELAPLGDFIVSDVRGEGVEDWKANAGKLVVNFSRRVLGANTVEVLLERPQKTMPEQIAIAPLRVAGAAKETTQISVAPSSGIQLKTAELVGVREIPGETANALGYVADRADWKLSLAAERLAPRVLADVFNLVTIGDGLVGGSATIRYAIVNQGVQEFRVKVPAHWKNIEFTGPNIRRKDLAGDVWTVALQDKAWGAYTLLVTYDFQFDPHRATLPVGGAHALDVERETGSIAVTSAAGLQLKEQTASDALRRIDETELAENDRALIARPALLAYRYAGDAYELGVDVTRFEETPVLQAVADRTQLTTVITDAGQMLTQASFMVKNNAKQYQRFTLPAGAELWSCFAAGQAVKAERDGEAVLVPLPHGLNRDQAVPVEIVFKQNLGALTSVFPTRLALAAPQTDIQTTYAEWELFIPETHRLAGFAGNMTVARGTTYDLRDAWREFLRFYDRVYHENFGLIIAAIVLTGIVVLFVEMIRRGWRRAVEVLVCLLIVAILAGMLLPALSSTREKARRTQELNNLKQIGMALAQYSEDRGGNLPASLDEIVGLVGGDRVFMDPSSGQRIKYAGGGKQWNRHADDVIAYSPTDRRGAGGNVLFADGRVQFVRGEEFNELVNQPAAKPAAPQVVAASTAAGIRPIRIDVPRTGSRFVFTKVLNVNDESLSVRAWAMTVAVRNVVRGATQATAFLAGLVLVWWQWHRRQPNSLLLTIGLALAAGGVTSLLVTARVLGVALIVIAPVVALAGVIWLARWWWKRRGSAGASPSPTPEVPPVIAAIVIALLAAGNARADVGVSVVSASYVGAIRELGARETTPVARVEATIELTSDAPNQTVRLFSNEVAVEQFTASPGTVKLARDDDGVRVVLMKAGKATVRVKFLVKLTGDVSKRRLEFGIPAALSSRLSVTLDESGAAVECPSAVSFASVDVKDATRVDAVIGSGERVELAWTPRVKRAAETAATVFCQNTSAVSLGAGVVNVRAALQFQITQGELRQARVKIPAGQTVLRVEGDTVRTWKFADDVVTVELLKPMAGTNFVLYVETERALDVAAGDVMIALPHAADAKRETGLVALRAGDELSAMPAAGDWQKADIAEFTQALQAMAARPEWIKAGPGMAYRFLRPETTLNVRVEPMQPVVEVVARHQFNVGVEELGLTSTFDFNVKKAGIFTVKLAVPAGFELQRFLRGTYAQMVTLPDGMMVLTLPQRTTGAFSFSINWVKRLTGNIASLELPAARPVEVQKLTEFVGVTAEEGVQVKMGAASGLTEIPPAEAQLAGAALAFKSVAGDWKLAVATESVQPWVRAEVVNWLTMGEALVTGRAQVRYEIQNAPVKEFRVKVPASYRNVEIAGADIRRRDREGDEWRVILQKRVSGAYTLTVTWDQAWDARSGAFESPGIEVAGVERETGAIAVIARSPLQVNEKITGGDLLRVDARELPEWAGRAPETTVLAYRYLRPGYKFAVAAKRFAEARVLQALVDDARMTTVIADDGQMMTEAAFSVRNNGRQHLEVRLPAGAQVWSAFVDGRPVRPSVREGKLLLPLERSSGETAIAVELTYVGAAKFPRGSGRVALETPAVDVPLKNARWEVYLPADYRYGDFAGTMTHVAETAPVVSQFSFGDYSATELKKKAEVATRLLSGLSSARGKLDSGDVKEAMAQYNQLRESDAFAAQSEEAQSLAKDLRQQQAGNFAFRDAAMPAAPLAGKGASDSDVESGARQFDKLQAAQEVAAAKVLPLRVNLPTHGAHHAFTQLLQTEAGQPMSIRFDASNARTTGWTARLAGCVAGFAVLWFAVAGVLGRRAA